jgi:hypothetical protein
MILAHNTLWSEDPTISGRKGCHARTPVVEFIGATGTGKTTLLTTVKEILSSQGYRVKEAQEALLGCFGLDFIRHPKVRSFLVQLLVMPSFFQSLLTREGRSLFALACRVIFRDAGGFFVALMLLRNVMKRMGLHQAMKILQPDMDYLLYDEGILHCAHNLFVHTKTAPNTSEIRLFADWIPLPDLVIWVTAPVHQSADCILRRGHPRVEPIPLQAQAFADHANISFKTLCSQKVLQDRLYKVDNTANGKGDHGTTILKRASDIAEMVKLFRRMKWTYSRAV